MKFTLLDAIGENETEEEAMQCLVTGIEILNRKVKKGLFVKVTSEDREGEDKGSAILTAGE